MALTRKLVSSDHRIEWSAALEGTRHSFWHRWDAATALQSGSGDPAFLLRCEDPETGAAAVCVFAERTFGGSKDIYGPGGFGGFTGIIDLPGLRACWRDFVAERGYVCAYFPLHPVLALGTAFEAVDTGNPLYVLDTRNGAEGLLDTAGSNVRRTIRSWRNRGDATLVLDREHLTAFVLRHLDSFLEGRGASPGARWAPTTVRRLCDSQDVLLVGAEDQEGLCIVAGFGIGNPGAEYLFNVNLREGRRLTAVTMAWAADQLRERGLEWLHLGGGLKPDDSLARAKQRYHPHALPFLAAREVHDADRFRALCREAGKDPDATRGYFPPYREPDA